MTVGIAVAFLWRCMLLGASIAAGMSTPGVASVVGWVMTGVWGVLLVQMVWSYLLRERL